MKSYRFELFTDAAGAYRFRFVAPNNKIMFASEGYKSMRNAKEAVGNIIWVIRALEIEKVIIPNEK